MRNWEDFVREHLALPELTPEREARIVRELAGQLEDFYGDALSRGLSESEADAHARRQIRDWRGFASAVRQADRPNTRTYVEQLAERAEEAGHRKRGGWTMFADVMQDVRYALRQLRRSPGFTTVAVLTLALGIGANTAAFSVVHAVLLRPLPYPQPDRLYVVHEFNRKTKHADASVAPPNFLDWTAQNTVFSQLAAINGISLNLSGLEPPERLVGARISWTLFPLLGIEPLLGRGFTADEEQIGNHRVVVLSHQLWQRRFGEDAGIIGRSIVLNDIPYAVVGVMPPGFAFPSPRVALWVPLALADYERNSRGAHYLRAIARLRPGFSLEQAETEMDTISRRLELAYPKTNTDLGVKLVPLQETIVGDTRQALYLLGGMVAFVLLIACANVANLLLARAKRREREVAMRVALGAGRGRIVRQFLTESTLLGAVGGLCGLALAYPGVKALLAVVGSQIPRGQEVAINGWVLGFTGLLTLVTGFVFGLLPALRLSGAAVQPSLQEGRVGGSPSRHRSMNLLVVSEVALALVLVMGAGLLLHSFLRLRATDPGFDPQNLLTLQLSLTGERYRTATQRAEFYRQLRERVEGLPRVTAAGLTTFLPMDFTGGVLGFTVEGQPPYPPTEGPRAAYRVVTPGYLEAIRVRLLQGRLFTAEEIHANPMVAVVDEQTVRRYWLGQNAVGTRFKLGSAGSSQPWIEVVGVVAAVRQFELAREPSPGIYVPHTQPHMDWAAPRALALRVEAHDAQLIRAVQGEVWALDPAIPISEVRWMERIVGDSIATQRADTVLAGSFGLVALLLAAVGVYGVFAFVVEQRTREFGVRIALGAQPRDIFGSVLRRALLLTLSGAAIGLLGTLALDDLLAKRLFEVSAHEPATFVAVTLLIVAVALAACWVPARRATRVDPLVALRYE